MGVLKRNMRDDVGLPLGNAPSSDNGRQMDMFEDERQRASWRRYGAVVRGVAKRGLVAFLAFAMAFGTTPAQMWAEGAESIADAVAASTGGEGTAADDGTAAADTGANGAAVEGGTGTSDAAAGQGATSGAAKGDDAAGDAAESDSSAAMPAAASEQGEPKAAAASATTLSSKARVCIQDTKDENYSYSTTSGPLKADKTLWANMYDKDEDDLYGSSYSVSNPGTWTYTWLAGTVKASSNVADYTEVVGHEQSLTVTDAMEGKYFICKVTADGKDYYGPSVSDGPGINANFIPGPVLGAGQMELYSVKLSSDTPSIGDTLTATPYISNYQQAPADAKVTYTWSASISQYSGFTKIEGATGASLVVGDDLEGKYIKVEATAGVNTKSKTTSSKVKQAGAVEISAVSIVNTKDNTSVFAVGDTAKARAKEKGSAYGAFVDADKLNFQWQSSDTKNGTYTDIAGATGETLELTDALGGKYLKCKVSSKIGSLSLTNSTGALVAAAGSINVTSVSMSPVSGKVEVGSTITATAKAGSTDVTADSHVTWQWYKGTSNRANSCNTPIEGETGNTLTVTAALKGYYVVAKANGGYGEQKPSYYAAGPVSVAGQVELYDVQFEGSPATNGVHVGDTLKTKVRKKDGSSYSYIGRTDNVTYQWQYANSSSSYDPVFTDIPGATEATYTVDAAYAGKYLRVKVTSENTVSSTQKKSSYGTQSVAPLGPVTLKGQYKLAGIELADKDVTLSVGSKITPSVQVPGSWSGLTKDVPDDADLTMAWYASENGTDWTELTDGIDKTDGSLTISAALVGKKIKVTASALDNTVEWVSSDSVTAAGEYNLLRVIANPQINSDSIHLVSGDSVKATVQAKRADGSTTNGIDVTDKTTVAWYAADDAKAPASDWTLLSDMSGAAATVSASASGEYLKAVATSGSSTVELVSANKVIAAGSLEAAAQKLNDANKQIVVDYNAKGGNVNDALKAQLADLGFTDVDVKVSEGGVAFKAEDAKATVGISDAQDKTNGDVTFFYIDPNDYTGYNIDGLRSADVVFELSRDGEKTEYYQPNKTVQVAWDEARVQQMLNDAAEQIAIGYAAGDSAESVTSNLTLPYRAGSKSKFEVSWKSSDGDVLWPSGYGWNDYTGKVTRASSDRAVTLTATVSFVKDGPKDVKGSHNFTVTVKGDPEKVAADKKALQEKVDAAFTYDNIKYSGTDKVADKDGLTADLQMPRTSTLNIDGKYYKLEYSASTDDITFNGYKGTVYQPLPGAEAANTKITLKVTDKSNAEVTASKTLDFAIAPQDQKELDAELIYLGLANASFYLGILDGQNITDVTGNLHAPLKVYGQGSGLGGSAVKWCYTTEEAAGHYGFVFSELPGGTENTYRLLKSSKPSVISHENLVFKQPEYNTKVTISGRLKSERFARYAERYPDNSDYAVLAGLDVSATVSVKGTTGLDSPNEGKTITVTAKVTGVSASDADGNYTEQSVVPLTEVTLPADEDTTAESVLEQLMTSAGCTDLKANGWGLTSATMPDGRVLGTTGAAPYSYWSFFVNNEYSNNAGAPSYYLKNGDCVEFRYVKGDGTQKPSTTPTTNPGADHPDADTAWNGFANGGSGSATDALTPTTKTNTPSWALNILTDEQQKAEASASASDPIVANGKVYLVTGASVWGGKTWNAVLNEIDSATGSVVRTLELGSSMDSTCRPVIAQGIILIPLSGGYLQAVSAKTFETLWYSDAFTKQNLSSLTVDGDYVYINTLDYWSGEDVQNGTVKRINIHTGAVAGSVSVDDGGFYWSGGVMANGYYVVGGDFGQVRVYSADLSKLVGSIKLSGGNIRSALTVHDGYIYAVTRDDGTLHRLAIGSDGSLTEDSKVQFAGYSTSTPVFSGNYVFIGGKTTNNWKGKGSLSIVDLSNMSVKQITKADGQELSFESKSTPLVSTHDGETYVYFTLNGAEGNWPNYTTGGGVYMYKLGDAEATEVFVPGSGYANFCMASVVCDQFGNLYYTNDSGHLFCVKSQAHRVKFDVKGGSSVDSQTPASGSTVTKPADPTREGYTFAGWYTDEACTEAYDFSAAVAANMTLYAKWTKNAVNPGGNGGSGSNGGNGGSGNAGAGAGSGNGTNGQQAGGAVAPGQKPVSTTTTTETKDGKDSKKDSDKSDKKSDKKGDKSSKSGSKSDTGTAATTAAKKSAEASQQQADFNPLAIVGVAAGVVGLAVIAAFVLTKRR